MQDLLNEDEFIIKKDHSPWKSFRIFYALCMGEIVLLIGAVSVFENIPAEMLAIVYLLSPLAMALLMVFHKPENAFATTAVLARGLFFLCCIYCLPLEAYVLIEEPENTALIFYMTLVIFIVCLAIVLPLARYKKRNAARR